MNISYFIELNIITFIIFIVILIILEKIILYRAYVLALKQETEKN